MAILVVNAGSSSLKLRALDDDDAVVMARDLSPRDMDTEDIAEAVSAVDGIEAVGHRIVHGGTAFSSGVVIDGAVETQLRALTDLAPLHQPKSLAALDAVTRVMPRVPAVACF